MDYNSFYKVVDDWFDENLDSLSSFRDAVELQFLNDVSIILFKLLIRSNLSSVEISEV